MRYISGLVVKHKQMIARQKAARQDKIYFRSTKPRAEGEKKKTRAVSHRKSDCGATLGTAALLARRPVEEKQRLQVVELDKDTSEYCYIDKNNLEIVQIFSPGSNGLS